MDVLPSLVDAPRLTLRRWQPSDAPLLGAAIGASVDHLRPWMEWIVHEPMEESARRDLIAGWERDWRAGGDVVLGAFLGEAVVGGCGLHRRSGPEVLEIGYWIHVDHLGQGYATEIARELTTAALSSPSITRVEIHHDAANVASGAVPRSLGFRLVGERPDEPVAPGELGLELVWSTTSDTWDGGRPTRPT